MRTRRTQASPSARTDTQLRCAHASASAPLQCSNNDKSQIIDIFCLIPVHEEPQARGTVFAISPGSPDWNFYLINAHPRSNL